MRTKRRLQTGGFAHCGRGGRLPKRESAVVAAAKAQTAMTEGASAGVLAPAASGSAAARRVAAGYPPATWAGLAVASSLAAGPPKGRPPSTDPGLEAAR